MSSPLLEKSLDFATQIVLFYEDFCKTKKDTTIAKQLLRSATSIGANGFWQELKFENVLIKPIFRVFLKV